MLHLKGDTAAFISAPGTSLPTSESERMPQERIFFFLLFLWFKQCHSWKRPKQLIPLSAAITQGCILCATSPSQSHCAQSFGALSPYSCLLAEMHTTRFPSSHSLPSNLKSNCFLLAFLVSILPSIIHLILLWILFSQGSWTRSNRTCILVWSWWVHCYSEAFPGLLNLGYVQKNLLLHIPVASSWVLHLLPACQWLSCGKQWSSGVRRGDGDLVASAMKSSGMLCPREVQFTTVLG